MYLFYIIALIPSIIGAVLFMCNKRINWIEWLGGTAIAFLASAIMHIIAITNMTADIETWSGKITQVSHFPQWIEEYKEAIYRTETYYTGSGKNRTAHTRRVFSHYETRHATHSENWVAYLDFGSIADEKSIDGRTYNEIKANFGNSEIISGTQGTSHGGHFDGGDNKIYTSQNKTGYIYPVTTTKYFENRIKAAPTVFSFVKVPENVKVYEWPQNPNWMISDRLLGESNISVLEFDRMNTRLGPKKLVNVIMVNFGKQDSLIAKYQQAKFIGGKKNDLVLCYGQKGTNNIAGWSFVFGWTESEICKRNLETILLQTPINNNILPMIEKEIIINYKKKDWHKFDYITIEPPAWAYIVLIIVMIITQTGFWIWASVNDFRKEEKIS